MDASRGTELRRPLLGALAALLAAGSLAACSSGGDDVEASTAGPSTTSRASSTSSTTAATVATTTSTVAVAVAEAEEEVVDSADIRAVQERLAELGYDVGEPDGRFGGRTSYSVMAFQKIEGLSRTGEIDDEFRTALATAGPPGPMVPGGPSTRIEVDLNRQVLIFWSGGSLTRILPISSGNGEEYCVDGECDVAVTPPGSFRIGRKAEGLEVAPLGELWWPMYFNGGIAIHGSPSVPPYPASHGCLRIPMYAAPTFYDQIPRGTAVILVGRGPGPEGVGPPPEPPPNPVEAPVPTDPEPTTTTTEAPPETTTPTTEPSTTTSSWVFTGTGADFFD
jgi:peptidoglycan hydrolase-like protein with peptidoglycan-binding domain